MGRYVVGIASRVSCLGVGGRGVGGRGALDDASVVRGSFLMRSDASRACPELLGATEGAASGGSVS